MTLRPRTKRGTGGGSRSRPHAQPGHLKNAPIIEALIDFKVEFPPGVGLEQLAAVQDRFRAEYPTRRDHMGWSGRFDPGEETDAAASVPEKRMDGYFFETPSRSRVVQVRLDGFSVHWMRPYDTWEALEAEARARWDDVRAVLAPVGVTKIGVRYINRVDVPIPINVPDWLLTAPEVSPALKRPVTDFFMQLRMPFADRKAVCVVSQAVEVLKDRELAGIIFDIDVGRTQAFAVGANGLWRCLSELREIKNEVFFKSITPKAKRLFQ